MGSDDIFKKRREDRKKRNCEFRQPKANSYLIVTEGKRTEPFYFKNIVKHIKEKMGGTVDVIENITIDINGEGCSTSKLIEKTDEIVNKAKIKYQHIWVVFDKDDFEDFDSAIIEATNKGYKVAWSNQSFEYWLYLHFNYSDSALHRDDWCEKLDDLFKRNNIGDGRYRKNYENIYDLVNIYNGVNQAINNAKRRMSGFRTGSDKPSLYAPGTKVYILVEELKRYLDE